MSSNPWNAFRSANKGKGWSPQKMTEEYQAWKASGAPLATSGSSHDVRREPRSNEPDGPPSSVAKPRTRAQTGANTSGSKDEKPLVLPAHDRKESVENAPLRSNAQQQSGNYRFLAAIRDDDEQPPQTSQFQTPSSVGVQERPHSRGFPDSPPATHDKQYATSSPRVTPSGLSAPQSPPVAAPPSRASGGKALGGSARPAGAQLKFSDDEHMLDTIADDDRKTPAASSGGRALRSRTQAEILELGKALAAAGLTLNDRNLFEHQIQGIQWMLRQERSNDKVCGGLLADDMGLGKTLQGICLILLNTPPNKTNAAALAPTLVMAPVSVMNAWANDMATFAPVLSKQSLKFHGPESSRMDPSDIAQYSLVLTTYDTMKARIETLSSVPWHRIILDEAQNIKNEKTARFEGCMKLSRLAKARWCITGTPLENGPEDVLSLFKFLQVKTYGDSSWFKRHFTMEQQDVAHVMSALTTTTIRRTKEGVNKAAIARTGKPILANKHLRIEMVQLSPAERMAHEDAEMESHALLRLLRGAQAANGTRHDDGKSTKVEGVFGKIAQLFKGYTETFIRERVNAKSETYEQYAKADKIVIFSRFMTTLDMLQEQLDSVFPDVEVLRLDGSTPEQMRHNLVHRFREGKGKMIFLAGLKSGGVGVNLQSAAAVFLVDPWWNPAVEKQAVDRVHRLNAPNKDVFCYRLRAQDSVDEIVAAKQTEKLAWVRHTIGMLEQHHLDDAGAFEPMVGPPA